MAHRQYDQSHPSSRGVPCVALLLVCLVAVGAMLSVGCAGKGEVLTLTLKPGTEAAAGPEASLKPIRVVVVPFEDARAETRRLGIRTHLWGGVTYFDVPNGHAGMALAQALAESLRRMGWETLVGDPAKLKLERPPDLTMAGTVREFTAHARGRFGSTVITSTLKADVRAANTADGSTVRMLLSSARSRTVFWFEPEDVEQLVSATVFEGVETMMAGTKVDRGILRVP